MKRESVWAFLGVLALACGGQVEEEPTDDDGTSGGSTATNTGGPSTHSGGKARLGDCSPGTPLSRASSCKWYAGQTCYSTKEAACNCICPTDVAEVFCISDMPADDAPTLVYCVGR